MATAILALFLVLLPLTATSDFLSPLLSPIFGDVCKEVECGKGNCKPSENSTFNFECECSPGWKQARSDDSDSFKFLPCVIPNCTLDYSCTEAPPPVQEKERRANDSSIFDPCYWTDCGGGSCNKTSVFTHKCECNDGYYNLLNVTAFPCFKECSIGMDCKNFGISVMNKSSSSATPGLPQNTSNQASSMLRAKSIWWIIGSILWGLASISWELFAH